MLKQLFGCSHTHTTFPMTLSREQGPHIVCLDCGTVMKYNFDAMKVGDVIPNEVLIAK